MRNLERGDIFLIISGLPNLQPDMATVSLFLWSHTSSTCTFSVQTLFLMTPVHNDSQLQVQLWEKFRLAIDL